MLICHVNLAPDYRGGERQAELLARELGARGHRQHLVIRRGNPLASRCADIAGLEVRAVASNPLAAALAARGSSVVHVHEARGVYGGWLAAVLFGIPYVITRRVPNPQRPSWIRDRAYRRAARLVVISAAVGKSLQARHADIDFDVIPDAHAALAWKRAAVTAIRDRYRGKLLIGHVGALDHAHKGQRTIIDAARRVRERHPDWHFLLCGSGRDEEALRAAAAGLDNIVFSGFVDNIGDYYKSFDVFVFPSLKEAIGSAMIDAMYFGLPIVASNVDGIPEFLHDGVNGRLIEPENTEQLIAGIEEIVSRDDWAAAVRAANRRKAATLDAAAMADRYEALYRSIA